MNLLSYSVLNAHFITVSNVKKINLGYYFIERRILKCYQIYKRKFIKYIQYIFMKTYFVNFFTAIPIAGD